MASIRFRRGSFFLGAEVPGARGAFCRVENPNRMDGRNRWQSMGLFAIAACRMRWDDYAPRCETGCSTLLGRNTRKIRTGRVARFGRSRCRHRIATSRGPGGNSQPGLCREECRSLPGRSVARVSMVFRITSSSSSRRYLASPQPPPCLGPCPSPSRVDRTACRGRIPGRCDLRPSRI